MICEVAHCQQTYDFRRVFLKDIKDRDYWERFERRMYQEQAEKRNQVFVILRLSVI